MARPSDELDGDGNRLNDVLAAGEATPAGQLVRCFAAPY
jgi:hypothetical protein